MSFNRNFSPHYLRTLFLSVVLIIFGPASTAQGSTDELLRVHFIDVGYGDAILVQLPGNQVMMVDAGEKPHAGRVTGYLRSVAVKKIDWAVITHPHNNHFGGFSEILRDFVVDELFVNGDVKSDEGYDELLALAEERGVSVRTLKRGMKISPVTRDVKIRALHPETPDGSINANSLVLHLTYRDFSLLLTGDIGKAQQGRLMTDFPELAGTGHVQIPHHAWPVHEDFTTFFSGSKFFASTGDNDWGYPDEQLLSGLDGTLYRTDRDGTIVISSNGGTSTVKTTGSGRTK